MKTALPKVRDEAFFNAFGRDALPGHLGLVVTEVAGDSVCISLTIAPHHLAPNGYLHAGTVVTLADTAAGYATFGRLPAGAAGFTTAELKCNHIGTAREGVIRCRATPVHLGRTTQVWDAKVHAGQAETGEVADADGGKLIAVFRCTQVILYA